VNELQKACKVIDELIVLLHARNQFKNSYIWDIVPVQEGMELIAKRIQEPGEYPVTMWLAEEMRKRGYLEQPGTPEAG